MAVAAAADIRRAIGEGAAIAIASSYRASGPSSFNMQYLLHLAVHQLGLSPEEAIIATTWNAACSLRLSHVTRSLEPGKSGGPAGDGSARLSRTGAARGTSRRKPRHAERPRGVSEHSINSGLNGRTGGPGNPSSGAAAPGRVVETARAEVEVIGRYLESAYSVTDQGVVPLLKSLDEWFGGGDAREPYKRVKKIAFHWRA